MRLPQPLWVTLAASLLYAVTGVHAGGNLPIAVSPVVVKMDALTEFSSVLVGNRGDQATGIEIEVFRVQWVDGQEQYHPTKDFIVSPPTFRLLANKDRLVRFRYSGLRHNAEDFYRMFIRQLPEVAVNNQINMVVNLGVPIFVAPLDLHPALTVVTGVGVVSGAGETKTYTLRNSGNVTLNVMKL